MFTARILEWPHPCIDKDWTSGHHQWREITPLAYRKLKTDAQLRKQTPTAFMQEELVDVLADGDGLHVCCKQENGHYFARLLPSRDWWKREYLPLPEVASLPQRLID